ncbi:hypothetical protein [Paenibacillus polymyxa]|uniref:Uncharacterized protein n=1 Tax=Paenibacillus polymyxa TaxID=1406 RepID=A0AAE9IBR4_PAEPO|nr:hypothetical protein [Paenibacillus polymyxa]URJ39944.1 hypothetical protein MF627_004539 [Paenibacillus polymyxa]URJ49209.1 hypothetical protein MF626_003552 [Paenibacillus polymyxa]
MWDIKEQIMTASSKLGIELSILPKEETENIKQSIMNKYLEEGTSCNSPLFERLHDYVGVDVPDSWLCISNLVKKLQYFFIKRMK